MNQPARDDPATPSRERDHAQVLDLIGSPEMQRRLEKARAKRARVLADRAAEGGAGPTEPAAVPTALSPDVTEANTTPAKPVAIPAANPLEDAAIETVGALPVAAPPVAATPAVRQPPVLRAPLRPAMIVPHGAVRRNTPAPPTRRAIRPSGAVFGLALGVFLGIGVTWVMGIARPDPLGPTGPTDVTLEAGDTSGAEATPTAAPSITVEGTPGRELRPRPRPAGLASTEDTASRRAANNSVARPEQRVARTTDGSVAPPPIAIDDILRSAGPLGSDPGPNTTSQGLAAGGTRTGQPARSAAEGTDPAPRSDARTGDPASSGTRLRAVVHHAAGLPPATIAGLRAALGVAGSDLTETRVARFATMTSEVRYFHETDAAGAIRIAGSIGIEARDFSAFRPSPPQGTLEIRLSDRRPATASRPPAGQP